MSELQTKDILRSTLKRLIECSNASLTADDVLREFRTTRENRSTRKLLKVLEAISKNQPRASEHLQEAAKLLEKKDPFYCLLTFLNHYSETNIMQAIRKKDKTKSSIAPITSMLDVVTSEAVLDIKERVVQAASSGSSRLAQNSTIPNMGSVTSPPSAFPALNRTSSESIVDLHINDKITLQRCNIAAIPYSSQENILIIELIYSLVGVCGSYIYPEEKPSDTTDFKLEISDQFHHSLRDLAQLALPLASHYKCIQNFIDSTKEASQCGQVLDALSDALSKLTHDYFLLLAQLERELNCGRLNMHKMLFYILPTRNAMDILAGCVDDIVKNELSGGQVLTLLFNKISSLTGDEEAQKFIIQLLQLAAVPYMNILQLWIQKGLISDPLQEFLVDDNEVVRREELPEHYPSDYWEKRYTIRRDYVPCFLDKVSHIILRTGKYLNVIRECGKKVPPQTMNLQFSPTNQNHITVIQNAYRFASENLLDVLLKENDLMGHLMSVKRYLLLNQGDFITQFMDSCEEELAKNVDQVLPMKLENLLGLTLRLSSANHDPYKDDVHCELLTYDLVTQMGKIMNNEEEYWQTHDRLDLSGLECFAFRYDVKWPISLVLNHMAISKYQMLFRQLIYCKHVERQLCKVWKANNFVKKFQPEHAELYRPAFTLRQRMMNAIQNFEYYMMIEVIEPNWHIFIQNMDKVENVDEVLSFHQDFLDLCLKNCMLTDALLTRSIFKLCNISIRFCDFIQSESTMVPSETFSEKVHLFDLEFTGILIGLLKQLNKVALDNPSDRFMNLVHRINFNSFYKEQIGMLSIK